MYHRLINIGTKNRIISRNFHSELKRNSSVLEADSSKPLNKLYHTSGLVLAVLTPVAFVMSPSMINKPIDLALGFIFPFHSYVAFNYIISDYVPKAIKSVARVSLLGITVIATAGLLRLNIQGVGLTETLKSLWCKPEPKK